MGTPGATGGEGGEVVGGRRPRRASGPAPGIVDIAAGVLGGAMRLTAAAVAGAEATLRLPVTTARLVVRLDELVGAALVVGTEVGPPLRRLVPVLDELAAVLAESAPLLRTLLPVLQEATPAVEQLAALLGQGAPLLRRLLPVVEAATPALEQLGAMGGDLVDVLGDAAPGLRRLVPVLDALDADRVAGLVAAADELVPALARAAGALPPDLLARLLGLIDLIESELPTLRVVGDTRAGLAAVTANTDHLVTMLDELYDQLRGIPGTGALLRRGRRQRSDPAPADRPAPAT
ncbi:MAG TPA: hypothetical protein VFP61_09315 [Acidimicrobiales bacterium]|nr:hypothetical protein [Acidimicrobiales bacterium]